MQDVLNGIHTKWEKKKIKRIDLKIVSIHWHVHSDFWWPNDVRTNKIFVVFFFGLDFVGAEM